MATDRTISEQQGDRGLMNRRRALAGVAFIAATAGATAAMAGAETQSAGKTSSCADVGTIWWSELNSADPEQIRDFYAKVIGWTPSIVSLEDTSRPAKPSEAQYTLYSMNGQEAAGLVDAAQSVAARPGWFTYIQVANVDAAVMAAVSNGGKIVKPPFDIPNLARIAVIEDPQGAVVGLAAPLDTAPCSG